MPFTLAHPIAALPLWLASRKRLNLLGLMVGTIVQNAVPGEEIAAIVVRAIIGLISGSFVGLGFWAIGFWWAIDRGCGSG
jgi:Domain of unknown function (DUF4184)